MNEQEITIRQVRPEDARAVCEVLRDSWMSLFENIDLGVSKESLEKEFEVKDDAVQSTRLFFDNLSDTRNAWVAEEYRIENIESRILGFCRVTVSEAGTGKINAIYLIPEAQGKGVGQKLFQTALDWLDSKNCKEITIDCVYNNERAFKFYKKFGFEIVADAKPEPHKLQSGEEIKVIRLKREEGQSENKK